MATMQQKDQNIGVESNINKMKEKETGGSLHQKKKKSVGYVKPEVDQKDNVSGWEGL